MQRAALARGLWIPVGAVRSQPAAGPGVGTLPTAGAALDVVRTGPLAVGGLTLRDVLLEVWAEDGRGRPFHAGAPVFKNVAGYNLPHLLAGAGGMLGPIRAATLKLTAAPACLAWRRFAGPVAAAWPAVAPLLARREPGPAAPVAVADEAAGTLVVLAAGRDRPWDLPAWLRELDTAALAAGLTMADAGLLPFVEAPERLPALVPAWAAAGSDWTVLAAADGGPCPARPGPDRWIRQAAPRLVWTPGAATPPALDADRVFVGGRATLPPAPPRGVPRHLLARLKDAFDPEGRLPRPDWLPAAGDRP